jgi:hypothetical protein
MTDVMRERGTVVNSAAKMFSSGNVNLDTMPQLILRIINEDMWRQRAIPQRRWALSREFTTFEEFVTGVPLDGLHTSVQMLKDVCRRDLRAVEAIDRATQHEPSLHTGGNNIPGRPEGTSQAKALRHLRKDRPDLLERVLLPKGHKDRLTAHQAMIVAGYRYRTLTVRADDPEHAARTLRKHYTDPEQRQLLADLIKKEN